MGYFQVCVLLHHKQRIKKVSSNSRWLVEIEKKITKVFFFFRFQSLDQFSEFALSTIPAKLFSQTVGHKNIFQRLLMLWQMNAPVPTKIVFVKICYKKSLAVSLKSLHMIMIFTLIKRGLIRCAFSLQLHNLNSRLQIF